MSSHNLLYGVSPFVLPISLNHSLSLSILCEGACAFVRRRVGGSMFARACLYACVCVGVCFVIRVRVCGCVSVYASVSVFACAPIFVCEGVYVRVRE